MLIPTPVSQISNPKNIAGLDVWFDATVGLQDGAGNAVTANNAAVTVWKDQSGNGYDISQATAAAKPTLVTSGLNGKNVINFNGSQYMAESAFSALQLTGSKKFYIFAVWKFNTYSGTADTRPIAKSGGYTSSSGTGGYLVIRRWDKSAFSGTQGFYECQSNVGGGLVEFGSGPFTSTNFHLAEFHLPRQAPSTRTVTASMFVDRTIFGTKTNVGNNGAPGTATVLKFTVGGQLATTSYTPLASYFNGQIAEICIYNRLGDLSQSEIIGLREYFKRKWAV